ncbi:E3 ubiquitin-protein ligase UPL5-like [Diospyros lotus]|uniref:E3 ubiquitin-protein ligase UPL5-like n=1 Tax=Diospyros lotus TaxID=55363 RepID=UPI002251775F|nr:E3 ubiquitin-protein ligase UPL5-like [Diospyros lotus]
MSTEGSMDSVDERTSSKRKLDNYAGEDDFSSNFVSVRLRRDENDAVNTTCACPTDPPLVDSMVSDAYSGRCVSPSGSLYSLQFFVRMLSEGKTLVLRANPNDTIKMVLERIQEITRIPATEQRLIYGGRHLQLEKSLAECSIQNDAGLHLVSRMRSTTHPLAWRVVNEMVSAVWRMSRGELSPSSKFIQSRLLKFLNLTPTEDKEEALGHFDTFLASSAPAALVMLYMSPHEGIKECAEQSIRQFICAFTPVMPYMLSLGAPILLEFCKLLSRDSHDDPLYIFCRSSLALMMDDISIGWGSRNRFSYDHLIVVQDIIPFITELAASISNGLLLSVKSPTSNKLCACDVRDFKAFLLPIRTAISEQIGFPAPFSENGYNLPCYDEEINSIHDIYTNLLEKMELCLQNVEECLAMKQKKEGELLDQGWSQYLSILEELNCMSELYQDAEAQFWLKLKCRKVSICYLITRYAKRSDYFEWILENKDVTDFESRRHLVMMMFPELKDDSEDLLEMLIDRSKLLNQSFEYIGLVDPNALRGGLFLEFRNEEATGPGVLREWFLLVCQEIFDPQNGLFLACPHDRRRVFPNPASKVKPMHLEYFSFCGRLIGLALMHKVQVGIILDRVFFLQLAGKHVTLEDTRDTDPFLYNSCMKILEMDPEMLDSDALGLTFVWEVEELGSRTIVELRPGGENIAVCSRNRQEYVDLVIQHCFVTSVSKQVAYFSRGFADILCNSNQRKMFFEYLELEDLDWMLRGRGSAISINDWKAHTDYNGYEETDPQIRWFWKIVAGMSGEERKILLFFWTSVKYLPAEGFRGLDSRLAIYKSLESYDHLPSSHTCFYRLSLPAYPSMAVMKARLRTITQECVNGGFGTG